MRDGRTPSTVLSTSTGASAVQYMPRMGHEIVALDVVLMHSIYGEEIGAMLDAMGFCMRRFTVGTGARG